MNSLCDMSCYPAGRTTCWHAGHKGVDMVGNIVVADNNQGRCGVIYPPLPTPLTSSRTSVLFFVWHVIMVDSNDSLSWCNFVKTVSRSRPRPSAGVVLSECFCTSGALANVSFQKTLNKQEDSESAAPHGWQNFTAVVWCLHYNMLNWLKSFYKL